MPENNRMNITGKNFLIALLIAFIITVVLTFLYSCLATVSNFITKEDVNFLAVINYLGQAFVSLFRLVGMCAVPVIFLLSFALLQRFRIKDDLDADEIKNEA